MSEKHKVFLSPGVTPVLSKKTEVTPYKYLSQGVTLPGDKEVEIYKTHTIRSIINKKIGTIQVAMLNRGSLDKLKITNIVDLNSTSQSLYTVGIADSVTGEFTETILGPSTLNNINYTDNKKRTFNKPKVLLCKIESESGVNTDRGSIMSTLSNTIISKSI